MINPDRPKVYWLGPIADGFVTEFARRSFVLEQSRDYPAIRSGLPFVRAVVFRYDSKKPGWLQDGLREIAPIAIDHGAEVIAIADNHTDQFYVIQALKNLAFRFEVRSRTAPTAFEIAELIADHDPGRRFSAGLAINGIGTESLHDSARILLGRAFSDCTSIRIEGLTGGKSANVFCVYAGFKASLVGPRPLPFFAKIDRADKIVTELGNYAEFAVHFIPFNLRPNLDNSRCLKGSSYGILVGNFVENSEALWDVAKRGSAQEAIYSLFDHALRGWRLQAYEGSSQMGTGPLVGSLGEVFDPGRVSQYRRGIAQRLGSTLTPEQLWDALRSKKHAAYRLAPIHGDLNAYNVRVRGRDAILIDFAKTRIGPIVADPASLEVSLAFAITSDTDDNEGWKRLIDQIYKPAYLQQPPPPAAQALPREWLWTCIRQIRLFAISMETAAGEYRDAVIAYLLRYAMFPAQSDKEETRRAYSLVLAERLLETPTAEIASGGDR